MSRASTPASARARFWARVDKATTPDGCWPWTGALSTAGRGRFCYKGRTRYAYVWALEYSGVHVPDGQPVRHLCGNPSCCRPDHLSAEGGQRENNLDAVEQGRHRNAKFDGMRVRRMRERFARDRPPLADLAAEHGVSESAVSAALTGRTWPRAGGPIQRSRKRRGAGSR